jgi:hypothetical protein
MSRSHVLILLAVALALADGIDLAVTSAPGALADGAVNRCQRRLLGGIARRQHVETALGREHIIYVGQESMALESNTKIDHRMTEMGLGCVKTQACRIRTYDGKYVPSRDLTLDGARLEVSKC